MSPHAEYRPLVDPSTWHKQGMPGLLDRQFRLLREDTVGQLRDSVRMELQALDHDVNLVAGARPSSNQAARTFNYRHVRIEGRSFHPFRGLEINLSFRQPAAASQHSTPQARSRWWADSRRLANDALVCLVSASGSVTFCTVASVGRSHAKSSDEERAKLEEQSAGLFKDRKSARIAVNLINNEASTITAVIERLASPRRTQNNALSLVEFPGVLLPAFFPTQRYKR